MRKAFRHTGVLMMMGVVALGLLGAAYTLWYEDVTVTSNVETGTFDADVSIHPWDDETSTFDEDGDTEVAVYPGAGRPVVIVCPDPVDFVNAGPVMLAVALANGGPVVGGPYEGCTGGDFPEGKPPTICDAEIKTVLGQANDESDNNHLILSMSGLYPLAGCQYKTDLHNAGSVPLHLSMTGGSYQICDLVDGEPVGCVDLSLGAPGISVLEACTGPDGVVAASLDEIEENGGQILYLDDSPVQLHAGEELICDVGIVLDQGADLENKVIIGSRTYRTHQWNEAVN